MSIAPITDHEAQAQGNMLSQYKRSPRLLELVRILVSEIQKQENFLQEILAETLLDAAEGVQLDNIYGKLVGLIRSFLTADTDYRKMLKVRIQANISDGEVHTILQIAFDIYGVNIQYTQVGRAGYILEFVSVALSDPEFNALAARLICDATASGVNFQITQGEDPVFRFDTGPGFDVGKLAAVVGSSTDGVTCG